MKKFLHSVFLAVACGLLLSACSGLRLVDNDVASFAQWPNSTPPAPGSVVVCDINPQMLAEGKKKAQQAADLPGLGWGNARQTCGEGNARQTCFLRMASLS